MLEPQKDRYRLFSMLGICDTEWILHKFGSYFVAEVIKSSYVVPPALSATFINTEIYANVMMRSLVASFQRRYFSVRT